MKMKKLRITVGFLAFIGLATLNFTQSESNFVSKALASSSSDDDGDSDSHLDWSYSDLTYTESYSSSMSSSAGKIDHGDNPSVKCPVWKKTYHLGTGNTGVDCESTGNIKCIPGKCPHET